MLIDCDTCAGRGVHCHDCVITVLLRQPPERVEFDDEEQNALDSLAEAGLVPRLRMVPSLSLPPDSSRIARGIA